MKKILVLALAVMTMLIVSSGSIFAADNGMTVTMTAQNGSGEDGTATLTMKGDADVVVMIDLKNGATEAQPVHIHKGSCANLDPKPAFPLTNLVNGKSESEVMVSPAELNKGGYAINVHKSASDVKTYVSCGDIKAGMLMASSSNSGGSTSSGSSTGGETMPATGIGDQPYILAALVMAALGVVGAGLRFNRRRI